ncbi:MAG: domain S-box [Thermoleophilia bacterium]|nr:domain S-box [Thermoleophilia bacterium]
MEEPGASILEDGGGRLLQLFDALPAAVAVVRGDDHVYEYVNASYERVIARPAAELVGRRVVDAVPEVAAQGHEDLITHVMTTGEPYYGTEVLVEIDRGGSEGLEETWFDFVYAPLRGTCGSIDGMLAHGNDVTGRVRARRDIERLADDLRVQHESLELVLEGLPAGVVMCDANGDITAANSQWRDFFGMPIDAFNDVASWDVFAGYRPDGSPYGADEYPLARAIAGEPVTGEQIVFRRAGGQDRTIEVSAAPIFDDAGDVAKGVAVFADVTDRIDLQAELAARRASARAQAQFEHVLQAAGDGIWVLDERGRTTMMNRAAQSLTGWSFEEMAGKPSHPAIHHSYADGTPYPIEECPIHSTVTSGESCQVEDEVFWRKDGTSFPVSYRSTPLIEGGQQIGTVQVFRDLTVERETEAERRRVSEALASQQQALQLNDEVLQGLTATKLAMDLGHAEQARIFLDDAIVSMRGIITDLLERDGVRIEPGELVRTRAADLTK